MGGPGSGRRSYRDTVEDCRTLSVNTLARDRLLRPYGSGALTWTNSYTGEKVSSVGFKVSARPGERSWVRLDYTKTNTGEKLDYEILLTTTLLVSGGRRWWFICPLTVNGYRCGRRVGKLHLPPGGLYFGCRHCYDLTYESCRESHRFDRCFADMGMSPSEWKMLMGRS